MHAGWQVLDSARRERLGLSFFRRSGDVRPHPEPGTRAR